MDMGAPEPGGKGDSKRPRSIRGRRLARSAGGSARVRGNRGFLPEARGVVPDSENRLDGLRLQIAPPGVLQGKDLVNDLGAPFLLGGGRPQLGDDLGQEAADAVSDVVVGQELLRLQNTGSSALDRAA